MKTKPKKNRPTRRLQHPSNKKGPDRHYQEGERLQKVLARGGVASRREIERWIEEGRLFVNGRKARLGERLQEGDKLQLNGRVLRWEKFAVQPTRVLCYYKPVGEVVTRRDPEGRPVIFTQLPKLSPGRWIAVGRLDINTQGLILVTNNGELANRLMHPSREIEREYAVRVLGKVDETILKNLTEGVLLDDGEARFDRVEFSGGEGTNRWYRVVVKEGRNRLVRRLWESQGITVSRLLRIRYGPVPLPEKLRAHTYYELDHKELRQLLEFAGLPAEKSGRDSEPALRTASARRTTKKDERNACSGNTAICR